MGLFGFFKTKDINEGVKDFLSAENAVLLDVRTAEEYAYGHIEKSRNLPLQNISQAAEIISDKDTPLFVYCQSGARSAQAFAELRKMGYTNVNDIGGIMFYRGKVAR